MPNGPEGSDGVHYRNLMYYSNSADIQSNTPRRGERFNSHASEELDPVGHFTRSALYAGIQSPLDGVRELTNHLVNRELLPEISIVSAPERVNRWTNILAQKAGAAVGVIPMFVALNKCVSGAGIGMGLMTESAGMTLAGRTALAGASGFVYGGVFQNTHVNQDSSHGFWRGRLDNAVTNAATFATMSYAHGRLAQAWLPAERLYFEAPLTSDLMRNIKVGALAGTIGGAAHAEVGSIMGGTGLASPRQLMSSMTDFAVMGAGFGALNGVAENRSLNATIKQRMDASKFSDVAIVNGRAGEFETRISNLGKDQTVSLDPSLKEGTGTTSSWSLGRDTEGRTYLTNDTTKVDAFIDGKRISVAAANKLYLSPGEQVELPVYKLGSRGHLGQQLEPLTLNVSSVPLEIKMGTGSFQLNLGETKSFSELLPQDKFAGMTDRAVIGRDGRGHFVQNLETDPMKLDFLTLDHKAIPSGQKTYFSPFNKVGVWHDMNSEMLDIAPAQR